jgi:Raf kinase inhibitor-like YbhB/YbcL family protein
MAIAVLLAAGCSSPGVSRTPQETNMAGFTLTSSDFSEGSAIPVAQSCDGANLSPALAWQGAPTGTAAFTLLVDDPDANGFVHWVAFDMPGGSSGSLPGGVKPSGPPAQGANGFGRNGYGGPCPPGGTHHYRFTLYALSAPLGLTGSPSAAQVRSAMAPLILAQTTLTGSYTRRR